MTSLRAGGNQAAPDLRSYQVETLAAIARELELHRSTLVVAATGTGKTVTFAARTRQGVSFGGKTLILVHRDELVKQAKRKCEEAGLWPDVEKGKLRANTLAKVVIGSVQTMRGARLKRWMRTHFTEIIVDECHHGAARGYRDIFDYFDGAKLVGFTATPDRADGLALGEIFASVAYRYEIKQAIADKFLVPIVARRIVVESVDLSSVAMRSGDFAQDQLAAVMGDERALRGVAVPLLELARDRLTIGFCADVKHAHAMAATMNRYRPNCARAVDGETDDEERAEILRAHAAGEYQFLFNCEVLTEGYDCPQVACVAMIRPTKSRGRFVQCVGRGLRPFAGKSDCLLLDFTGTAGRHRLVGPVDCLLGMGEPELDDEVNDEILRLLGAVQMPLEVVTKQAEDEIGRRREAMQIAAVVRYRSEHIDPFVGDGKDSRVPPYDPKWHGEPASPGQLKVLEDEGVTLTKLPRGFSRADAWKLLAQLRGRKPSGLCSYKAAKKLTQAGVVDTRTLSAERAKELLDLLRMGDWRPSAIAREPEVRRAPALEAFA